EEERVVVLRHRRHREAERAIDADAEHEQVAERIHEVPEDEGEVGRADLSLAVHHGAEPADHDASRSRGAWVTSTKMSSRLAPPISTRSTCPRRDSSVTSSSTAGSSSFKLASIVLWSTLSRSGWRDSSSATT